MKVSIVIPCHNAEPYLAQAIGSALDQSRPPHEIIVVDDGSTDGSLALACRFEAATNGQVRALSHRSGNAPRTRNLGAMLAMGEALMFLDADDVLAPNALEALAFALSKDPQAIAICPWYRLELADGKWVKRPPSCRRRRDGEDALAAWLTGWYAPPCAVLWSRSAYERTGGWDNRAVVNNDGDLMMRALASGIPLVEAADGDAYYRRLPQGQLSLSGTRFTPEGLASRIRTVEKIAAWLAEYGRLDHYRVPLCEALYRIASDAGEQSAELREQALTCARQYAPSARIRITRRILRLSCWPVWNRREPERPQPKMQEFDEIHFGMDRAAQVLNTSRSAGPTSSSLRVATRPLVSVVIPTYNRAELLPRAIDSVLAQTFQNYELLVVDDGSTDATESVVSRYADPRVRYLRQPKNLGVSAARNRGMRESRGDFLAFLDSDDEWLPEKLSRQLELFQTLPADVGLIYTGVETIRGGGARLVECTRRRGDIYHEMLLQNVIYGGAQNAMIRREVIATVGFFDERIPAIEDYDYWLRITRFFKVDCIEEPLIRYHDPHRTDRRSLAVRANMEARWEFYRKHVAEMRRAGVAHLFLLESLRRALIAPQPDLRTARKLAAQAVLETPCRTTLGAMRRTILLSMGPAPHRRQPLQSSGST